jgi:TolB-like protein/tetratricopeptide (TPR) repeat protein
MGQESEPEAPAVRRVFVSYARADQTRVEALVGALSEHGLSVWWDGHIAGGAAYAREIETSLRAAVAVVVAWSAAAVQSDWVRDEAALARDLGRLVPVRLDDTPAPLGFGQYQLVDLARWDGRPDAPEIARLIHAIDRVAGVDTAAPLVPTPQARRGSAHGPARRAMLLGGLVLVPIAGLGAWWLTQRSGILSLKKAPPRSIAVLPFANLSGDAAQDYFSDGLSEELIGALARLGALQVVARTSSFKFKGSKEDSGAIGSKLGVAFLLDGSVRRDASQVRVSAQLVDARTGFERWSQIYDRELKDIFAVQSSIAQAVAEALKVQLLGGDIAALNRGGTVSPEAYDAYLQGRRLFDIGGVETSYRDALAKFDAAIAADPQFAGAHAARARVLVALGDEFVSPDKLRATYDAALASARRSVELAPALAEAQATLGQTLWNTTLNYPAAAKAYARAIATGGGEADILMAFGLFSCDGGDFGSGLAAVRRAATLDPLNPRVFKFLGYALTEARRYGEAIGPLRHALELSPGSNGAHKAIGDALLLQGDLNGAKREYASEPVPFLRLTGLAIVLRRLGDRAGAEAALAALLAGPNAVALYQQAQVFAQWGDGVRAFAALEAAYKAGDSGLVLLKTDPMMDPLRGDPRFAHLLSRLGLAG